MKSLIFAIPLLALSSLASADYVIEEKEIRPYPVATDYNLEEKQIRPYQNLRCAYIAVDKNGDRIIVTSTPNRDQITVQGNGKIDIDFGEFITVSGPTFETFKIGTGPGNTCKNNDPAYRKKSVAA